MERHDVTSSRNNQCRLHVRALALGGLLIVAGCGGVGPGASEAPPPAASVGEEPPPVSESEPIQQPASTASGSIVVTARVDGQPVAAQVDVLNGDAPSGSRADEDQVVQASQGSTGEQIRLSAGEQRIAVTISDSSALLDKPTQKLSVFVQPGKATPVEVTFPWAKVRLDVLVNGRSQHGVTVKLMRGGEVVGELKSGAPAQAVSPGKYEADVLLRGGSVHVTGLQFLDGAEQTVPVHARL